MEKLGLFEHVALELDECCGDEKTDDCHDADHLIQEMQAQELQLATCFELNAVPTFDLPSNAVAVVSPTAHIKQAQNLRFQLHPPPLRLLTQSFLC